MHSYRINTNSQLIMVKNLAILLLLQAAMAAIWPQGVKTSCRWLWWVVNMNIILTEVHNQVDRANNLALVLCKLENRHLKVLKIKDKEMYQKEHPILNWQAINRRSVLKNKKHNNKCFKIALNSSKSIWWCNK